MLSLGIGLTSVPVLARRGPAYDPDAIFAALQAELTAAGLWSGLDALYINGGVPLGNAVVNLKQPGVYNLSPSGGPVLSKRGFSGDGVDAYLSTGFLPNGSQNYKKDDASAFAWVTSAIVGADYAVGATTGDTVRIIPRQSDLVGIRSRLNCSGSNDVYAVEGTGFIALRRNNSANYQVFKNGNLHGSLAVASTAIPSGTISLLRTVTAYASSGTTIAAEGFGRAFTNAEMVLLHRAIGRALFALGHVISEDEYRFPVGCTTWFNDPRAIALDSSTVLTGGVAIEGSIVANMIVDGEAGRQTVLDKRFEVDDHDNPAYLKRASDGRVMAWWAQHTGTTYRFSLSSDPECSSWSAPVTISSALGGSFFAYANPVQLTGEVGNPIHLFLRCTTGADDRTMHRAILDETGAVVTPATVILSGTRPYFKVAQNGGSRIDFFCNDGSPPDVPANSLYHFYYQGGAWFDSFGNNLGSPPFLPSSVLTRIYNGASGTGRSWVWDGQIIGGKPAIAHSTYPSTSDHRYRRAIFSGGAWVDEEICVAGGDFDDPSAPNYSLGYYSGGICQDPENENTVYCSRQVDAGGNIDPVNGIHQLYKYTKSGGIWVGQKLTSEPNPCVRPFIIPGTRKLQYVTGRYTSYDNFDTRIRVMTIA